MDEKETDEEDELLWTIFSIHSIFYLTRQPFHALHKEENNYVKLVGFGGVEREGSNQRYFRKTSKSSVEF